MANQVRFTPLPELIRLAEAAKASGCELGEILGDTSQMYTAQGALIDFYEAAVPDAFLALINEIAVLKAGGQLLVRDRNDAWAERDRLKIEIEVLRSHLLEAK